MDNKSKLSGGVEMGIDIATSGVGALTANPLSVIYLTWKVYDIFFKDVMFQKKKFSELQIENIDHQLVKLREDRAIKGKERRDLIKAREEASEAIEDGRTAALLRTSEAKVITISDDIDDKEFDIRYLCVLRRFFVRTKKYDKPRYNDCKQKMDTMPPIEEVDEKGKKKDIRKELEKAGPGMFRKGDLQAMVDAFIKIDANDKANKRNMIRELILSEGNEAYTKLMIEMTDWEALRKEVEEAAGDNTQ